MSTAGTNDRLGALLLARAARRAHLGPYRDAAVAIEVEGTPGWTLQVRDRSLALSPSAAVRDADATVRTDPTTMEAVAAGTRSPVEAFLAGDLRLRGNLELALRLSSLFVDEDTPAAFPRPGDVRADGVRTFTIEAGAGGPPIVLLHGLGATNASMLPTMEALAPHRRILAPDLPGFGGSDKPLRRLHAAYFAGWLVDYLDALDVERADLVGNSMGGRIAIEAALRHPDRVGRVVLLAPSPAWLRDRRYLWLVRLLRAELALLPVPPLSRGRVTRTVKAMFHDRSRLPAGWVDAAVDEFLRVYGTARGRRAFYSAARQIYLEDPFEGRGRFWSRLEELDRPALFVWGEKDRLVPVAFVPHVERALPDATSVVLPECGHVPQFECPADTHRLIRDFLGLSTVDRGTKRPVAERRRTARRTGRDTRKSEGS